MTILNSEAGPSRYSIISQNDSEEDPLRKKRQSMIDLQKQVQSIRDLINQLKSISDPSFSFSQQKIHKSIDRGIAGPIKDGKLLIPLTDVGFIQGSSLIDYRKDVSQKTVFVDKFSKFSDLALSNYEKEGKYEVPIDSILARLAIFEQESERDLFQIKDEIFNLAKSYVSNHLNEGIHMNEKGEALNEEGLPFVDLTEQIPDDEKIQGKGVVQTFKPIENKSKEDRKEWMNSILNQLENEEKKETGIKINDSASKINPIIESFDQSTKRPVHSRSISADRPIPTKSALKHTNQVKVPPIAKFGASGMRKGFLNMNPSSPAAEHSSDPIEKVQWMTDDTMTGSTSSLGSVAEQIVINNGEGEDERVGRKLKSKKKKTVRIQSPESQRDHKSMIENLIEPVKQIKSIQYDNEDKGNEEEAKQIVNLLGIDAISGHPQFQSIKKNLSNSNDPDQDLQESTISSSKRKNTINKEGPSVRKDVIERSPQAQFDPKRNQSAFKKGFLNNKPKQQITTIPPLPLGPQTSQGISALERATNIDDSLSEERIKQGLSSIVPHARPSKAFAEKIKARKNGESESKEEVQQEEEPARMSKVRFGETKDGNIRVKVGTAASESTNIGKSRKQEFTVDEMNKVGEGDDDDDDDDDDDFLEQMGLEVHEQELDEDQVEALGYFSDEEMDPDIGFDSDDMMEAIVPPKFDGDSDEIQNDDLRKEYERIKASLMKQDGFNPNKLHKINRSQINSNQTGSEEEEENLHDGQDISLIDEEISNQDQNISRFRRERLHRAMMEKRAISHELGTNKDQSNIIKDAQNIGRPSMLIPSIANVRFPKRKEDGSIPIAAHEIQLDGKSDDEDDRLEDVMRARLAQREMNNLEQIEGKEKQNLNLDQPPELLKANSISSSNSKFSKPKEKKTSLFKTRIQEQREDDR